MVIVHVDFLNKNYLESHVLTVCKWPITHYLRPLHDITNDIIGMIVSLEYHYYFCFLLLVGLYPILNCIEILIKLQECASVEFSIVLKQAELSIAQMGSVSGNWKVWGSFFAYPGG